MKQFVGKLKCWLYGHPSKRKIQEFFFTKRKFVIWKIYCDRCGRFMEQQVLDDKGSPTTIAYSDKQHDFVHLSEILGGGN